MTNGGSEELAKLREEIAALRKSTQALSKFAEMAQAAQAVKELEKSAGDVETKLVPGKATPEVATETALSVAVGGDVETLTGLLTFTESSRAKAEAWFASLTEGVTARVWLGEEGDRVAHRARCGGADGDAGAGKKKT